MIAASTSIVLMFINLKWYFSFDFSFLFFNFFIIPFLFCGLFKYETWNHFSKLHDSIFILTQSLSLNQHFDFNFRHYDHCIMVRCGFCFTTLHIGIARALNQRTPLLIDCKEIAYNIAWSEVWLLFYYLAHSYVV